VLKRESGREGLLMFGFYREPEPAKAEPGMSALKDFRDRGQSFVYLDRQMLVREISFFSVYDDRHAYMSAEYVDDQGRIQSHTFYPSDLPMLKAQNP
jgi:hypothetical protein